MMQKLIRMTSERSNPAQSLAGSERMVGESQIIQDIKSYIEKAAASDCSVLITGETGTGKELVAQLILQNSRRRDKPFICVNCAAIPESLFESELFGFERGAFTGAHATREGKLEQADGGTIFFDEIGDMSLSSQAKILRALESKGVQRLGSRHTRQLDFRVIAATNCNLKSQVKNATFRADLYFRLSVVSIHVPPLRDRKQDILSLIERLIQEFNRICARNVQGFTESALSLLLNYAWPGNVRELRNVVEATFVNLPNSDIPWIDLPKPMLALFQEVKPGIPNERDELLAALLSTGWNKSRTAEKLHWSRMTLYRKIAKYRLCAKIAAAGATEL
jgi:transcriptional regulator with PAS, ATPase and Fis domain